MELHQPTPATLLPRRKLMSKTPPPPASACFCLTRQDGSVVVREGLPTADLSPEEGRLIVEQHPGRLRNQLHYAAELQFGGDTLRAKIFVSAPFSRKGASVLAQQAFFEVLGAAIHESLHL